MWGEAREVAERLTKAERQTVTHWAGTYSEVLAPALDPLWWCITKSGEGRFKLTPTNLGVAVRRILQENRDDR